MYNNNNGRMTSPDFSRDEPTKRPLRNAASAKPTVAVLAFTVLLCVFSCSLTVALSYKWHADTGRQINVLLGVVEEVTCDLKKLTVIIRSELVNKRLRDGDHGVLDRKDDGAGSESTGSTAATVKSKTDYDDSDDDYALERFMGIDLFGNKWPAKSVRGPSEEDSAEQFESRRIRRNAEVDAKRAPAAAATKNQLNGSNYDKSNVDVLQDDANEENTVKTYSRRRPKKMGGGMRKKPEDVVSYELKDSQDIAAAAAHFISDSSKYNTIIHPHYDGNGRLRHPDGEFKDWTAYIWDGNANSANHFQMKNGKIEVSKPGVYFVYAQIYYSDQHDINGYYIMKNNEKTLGCTTTRHRNNQSDSCYTGGLINLNSKDILSIKGLDSERYILLDPVKSFFGLFQISSKDGKR